MQQEAYSPKPLDWRAWGRMALAGYWKIAIVNLVIAIVLTVFQVKLGSFPVNLMMSMCIGSLAYLSSHVGIWVWRSRGGKNWGWITLYVLVCSVSAILGGLLLGGSLLGLPLPAVLDSLRFNRSMYATMAALMTGFSLLAYWLQKRIEQLHEELLQHQLAAEVNARRQMQAQLQLLQAQIEPHMLFNTLATLQGLIGFDPARAQEMLEHLIHFLRASLQSARATQTTLDAEFELLTAYLALMQIRMGARLQTELSLPPELGTLPLAPMLLQPLVENAIKHGLEPKIEGGLLQVRALREADFLLLQVEDHGLGLQQPGQPGTRVGVANTRERLQALYGPEAALTLRARIADTPEAGTLAELRIPLARLQTGNPPQP